MQSRIRYCLICIFLCAPFFSKAQIALGDSLYLAGEFGKAFIAYEYSLFNGTRQPETNLVLLKSAYCLKQSGKFEKARTVLDQADLYTGSDSLRFLVYYEYTINSMLANKYDLALSKMEEMHHEFSDTTKLEVILPLEIISLNELHRWPEAHEKYLQSTKNEADPYGEILSYKMKNPNKAFALSYYFPGMGQMYAGYFWKGLVSTLLNAGLIYFSIWSLSHGYFFSGAFTGVALFYLSYNGGAKYAATLAKQQNETRIRSFNEKIKRQLLK
jgi:tetratricopeptide (TPR) repeat protein